MIRSSWTFSSFKVVLIATSLSFGLALAAEQPETERQRYANRPDDLVPYAKVPIYKDIYAKKQMFPGAGREIPEPNVETVRVGLIGPLTAEDEPIVPALFKPGEVDEDKALFGRRLLRGAQLAMEEANAAGGYKGKPFEMVRRTDLVQWGQTSNELAKFTYDDKVWAIISSIDSNHSHVLNRATLKAEVPLVNAGSTDPTLTEHNIPWLIRCVNDDRLNAYELLNYIYHVKNYQRIAVLRVNDRDGRVGVSELIKGARRLNRPVRLELRFQNGDHDFSSQLEHLRKLDPDVIVLWANPAEGAAILKQMKAEGMAIPVVGFDRMSHPLFLEYAGEAANGVVVASTYNPTLTDARWVQFREAYQKRFNDEPDAFATHGYDAMALIVEAVRKAGLNRVLIRDYLYSLDTFAGVSGEVIFDRTMNDLSRPWLAEVKDGKFEYFRSGNWNRELVLPAMVRADTE